MSAILLRLICAWCRLVLREGTAGAPTSHGMCASCQARFDDELAEAGA
jgi:hypothetical protein